MGVIAILQIFSRDSARTTRALRYIIACHLNVDAAWICSLGMMNCKKALNLLKDAVEWTCLVTIGSDGIAMHRITGPDNIAAFLLHGADQLWQMIANLVVTETGNQCQSPSLVCRIEQINQTQKIVGLQAWSALEAKRVLDATAIFNMRVISLTGTIADPDHV